MIANDESGIRVLGLDARTRGPMPGPATESLQWAKLFSCDIDNGGSPRFADTTRALYAG